MSSRSLAPQARLLIVCLLLSSLVLSVSLAQEPDAFVSNLVRMLKGDVDEKVIKQWMAKQPPLDRPLTADEVAKLSEAGASRSLLLLLVAESPTALEPQAVVGPIYGSRKIPVLLGDFMIDVGVLWASDIDTNVRLDLGPAVGVSIRLEDLLGFPENATSLRSTGSYRYRPKHGVEWSYIRFDRSAERRITKELEIFDLEFEVGASVATKMDQGLFKLAYQHLFVNNGRTAAGMSFGYGIFAFDYKVAGEATVIGRPIAEASAGVNEIVPLPTIGVLIEQAITPRLILRTKLDFFAFKVVRISDYRGRIFDGSASLQYFFSRNVSIGGGIVGTSIQVENEGEDAWDVASDLSGLYGFVGFAF